MAEYIEREKVIKLITSRYENPELCEQEINSIPAADVAPVVRCRECKYYTPQKKSKQWNCKTLYCNRVVTVKTKPNDFCSYGERR